MEIKTKDTDNQHKLEVKKTDISIVNNTDKIDFFKFLEENKKELNTGFGAFHTNGHSNW